MKANKRYKLIITLLLAALSFANPIALHMTASSVHAAETKIYRLTKKDKVLQKKQVYTLKLQQLIAGKVRKPKEKIKWSVSNKKILGIKVTENNRAEITGKKTGTATVTAKVTGGKKYKCTITVKTYVSTFSNALGFKGNRYLSWLKSHENDHYYLGTPYIPYDWRSPNGDPNYYGNGNGRTKGMNCTGFVWHVFVKSGASPTTTPALNGWVSLYRSKNIERRYYKSAEAMLNAGFLDKGDIVWIFVESENVSSPDNHIVIYYGDGYSNRFWQSDYGGNRFRPYEDFGASWDYVVIKTTNP